MLPRYYSQEHPGGRWSRQEDEMRPILNDLGPLLGVGEEKFTLIERVGQLPRIPNSVQSSSLNMPSVRACLTACTRLLTPNLEKMWLT
jgi:hypothetical protein